MAETGWLNLIGRWPLEAGRFTVGAAEGNDIQLPLGPDHVGTLDQAADGIVTFTPADGGEALQLVPDKKTPPRFRYGQLLLEIMTLNGVNALRVRDTKAAEMTSFPGIDTFPADPAWRKTARWAPLSQPMEVEIDTVIGVPTKVTVTHSATFEHDGKSWELIPTHGTAQAPQFVIRDLTSRTETYPAARFLFGEDITDSTIVLDFNKAINPPCAYTVHAVCPLPLPGNVLPFRIEAGELKPEGH